MLQLVLLATLALGAPAARAAVSDDGELRVYVRARAADSLGASNQAVLHYGAALSFAPDNQIVASNAMREALASGDNALSVKAARVLDRSVNSTPEVRLLLLTEAVRTGDWAEAQREVDLLGKDDVFGFMAPILRSWIAVGAGKGDPIALLAASGSDPLVGSYVAEHRPLVLLAMGRERDGLIEIRNRVEARDTRSQRLVLAGASYLLKKGRKDDAMQLLGMDETTGEAAQNWLKKHGRLTGAVATPAQGIAEFFLRISIDLRRQDVGPLALSFARLSTFLDPDYSEGWVVASELLASQSRGQDALSALANITADDPAADRANDVRIGLLSEVGDQAAALKQAEREAKGRRSNATDWTRLGDLYAQLDRHRDAADAYGRALHANRRGGNDRAEWMLWLLVGGARDQAGQWPEAKAALEAAYKLAPNEPLVLNYLGYAQLERRENIDEAEKLISQASRLQPDSAQITDSLGWARYLKGDVPKAIELLERAVQGEPTDAAINEHLGDAYFSAGRRYEARYAWNAALATAADKDALRLRTKIATGLTPDLASP